MLFFRILPNDHWFFCPVCGKVRKNPSNGIVAIMTRSDADEACPVVRDADCRTTIKF